MFSCFQRIPALLCFGISYCQLSPKTKDFKKLFWLESTWVRTNIKHGHSGEEEWPGTSPAELRGFGITMNGTDTLFVEKFRLVIKDNTIYYVADVRENKQPVDFKLTEISTTGFTCENPQHDFPKKISYQEDGNTMKASISGDGKSVDYFFEKK
jgi:Domain of unknown function (DUF6265)